jgi:hypothetical protein
VQLDSPLAMNPGRVSVTVRSSIRGAGPTMVETLDRIHEERKRRGCAPMTAEEMQRELDVQVADDVEYERRWAEIWSESEQSENRGDAP